ADQDRAETVKDSLRVRKQVQAGAAPRRVAVGSDTARASHAAVDRVAKAGRANRRDCACCRNRRKASAPYLSALLDNQRRSAASGENTRDIPAAEQPLERRRVGAKG